MNKGVSKGRAGSVVYRIEARSSYPHPEQYAGMLLGSEWQTVPIGEGVGGVRNNHFSGANRHGFLTYEAAQSLRWAFHAAEMNSFCVETRLVAYDFEATWEATRKSASEAQRLPRRPWDDFSPAQGTETRSAETTGSVGEADDGPVHEGDAPKEGPDNAG